MQQFITRTNFQSWRRAVLLAATVWLLLGLVLPQRPLVQSIEILDATGEVEERLRVAIDHPDLRKLQRLVESSGRPAIVKFPKVYFQAKWEKELAEIYSRDLRGYGHPVADKSVILQASHQTTDSDASLLEQPQWEKHGQKSAELNSDWPDYWRRLATQSQTMISKLDSAVATKSKSKFGRVRFAGIAPGGPTASATLIQFVSSVFAFFIILANSAPSQRTMHLSLVPHQTLTVPNCYFQAKRSKSTWRKGEWGWMFLEVASVLICIACFVR